MMINIPDLKVKHKGVFLYNIYILKAININESNKKDEFI